ncbi:radical SAM protein [Candidatus Acetothermia bacterium]|nr:radical SAM protein [Candidatus Acetothermia bacterium]
MVGLKPSRYTQANEDEATGQLTLHNTSSGVLWDVPAEWKEQVLSFLQKKEDSTLNGSTHKGQVRNLIRWMRLAGLLVPEPMDEYARARAAHRRAQEGEGQLQLILMPTEQCNFRCVYCYETFIRPKMKPEIRQGIKNLVRKRANSLKQLQIAWFGGEPLVGFDVVRELSRDMIRTCTQHHVAYRAGMTTNGYLLTPSVARELVEELEVRDYQITLDGPPEEHNRRRKLIGGQSTFERIFENLKAMKQLSGHFRVAIRMNFDMGNHSKIPNFIERLAQEFGEDSRFSVLFRPVEEWGGPNKANELPKPSAKNGGVDGKSTALPKLGNEVLQPGARPAVPEGTREASPTPAGNPVKILSMLAGERKMMEFSNYATQHKLKCLDADILQPEGYVCYAAKPYSLVVGSDGTLYKCTVAFSNEKNHVGKLLPDGTLQIHQERFNLWVKDYVAEDKGCQSCHFLPACHGSACPLIRIETGKRPCPPPKRFIKQAIGYTAANNRLRLSEQDLFGTLVSPEEGKSQPESVKTFIPLSPMS